MPAVGPYLIILIAVVVLIARSGRSQNVQPTRIWVVPALGIFVLLANLGRRPTPNVETVAIFAAALVLGVGVGWFRALHTEVSLDQESGQVTSRNTMLGTILLVGFIALRIVFERLVSPETQPTNGMEALHRYSAGHPTVLFDFADAGLIFSVAMMATRRLVIWRRASALLSAHRVHSLPPQA